jgi:Tfp pilus assembly protein PilN
VGPVATELAHSIGRHDSRRDSRRVGVVGSYVAWWFTKSMFAAQAAKLLAVGGPIAAAATSFVAWLAIQLAKVDKQRGEDNAQQEKQHVEDKAQQEKQRVEDKAQRVEDKAQQEKQRVEDKAQLEKQRGEDKAQFEKILDAITALGTSE